MSEEVQQKVALAVSELCTNAVRASSAPGGQVCLVLELDESAVAVVVANAGDAFERPPAPDDPLAIGGRGLAMVEALADELDISHEDGVTLVGCRVVMRPA